MIEELAQKISDRQGDIDRWIQGHMSALPGSEPPVYASVDIRNAGFKIGVVDTNLFPAGFNNLCETFSEKGTEAFRNFFQKYHPSAEKVLIFPEEHTRNLYYWKSIAALRKMLRAAGRQVEIGSASQLFPQDPFVIEVPGGEPITVRKIFLKDHILRTTDWVPDLILINNDLSSGTPDYLKKVHQPLLPPPFLGWHRRRKSDHFVHYDRLIQELASILEIDPWLLSPLTMVQKGIDFSDEICVKMLKESADQLLSQIRQKYLKYGIKQDPYLFVKNNAGTYGMGIIHIQSGDELLKLNRKMRNKLESSKGGQKVGEYLIQEGIPTADLYLGKPLEPVVYLVGGEAIGTFFRHHAEKDEKENLNAPGMSFGCVCLHKVVPQSNEKTYQLTYDSKDHLFTTAALLGQVASLATVLELHQPAPLLQKIA